MPLLTKHFYRSSGSKKTNIYIETGTYLGTGVHEVKKHYKDIHSIEVSEKWFNYNVDQFKNDKHIIIHLGDSKLILNDLCKMYEEPITFFLDAHYSGEHTSMSDEESPLLEELDTITKRNNDNDIIIIDDTRMIGKSGITGNNDLNSIYPETFFDWRYITFEKIREKFDDGWKFFDNQNYMFTSGPSDQIVIVNKKIEGEAFSIIPSYFYEFRFKLNRKFKNLF